MENEKRFDVLFEELRMLRVEVATLSAKLNEVMQDRPVHVTADTLDNKITNLLHDLKVPANLKGYSLIRDALKLVIQDFNLISKSTTVLYPTLAKQYDTTPSRVERAIRHAIEVSYKKNRAHPYFASHPRNKPVNSQFLADMADRFRLEDVQLQAVGQE